MFIYLCLVFVMNEGKERENEFYFEKKKKKGSMEEAILEHFSGSFFKILTGKATFLSSSRRKFF